MVTDPRELGEIAGTQFSDNLGTVPHTEASAYDEISHDDLIGMFYDSEGKDREIGYELGVRYFAHADLDAFDINPETTPIRGRDREIVIDENGKEIPLAGYINFATEDHFDMLDEILDFLRQEKGSDDYNAARDAILRRLGFNQDPVSGEWAASESE